MGILCQLIENYGCRLFHQNLPMASLIAILDLKGKPLIQRSYRDDVPLSYVERFLPLVLDIEEEGQQVMPCISSQGINYMHIRHSNLYRKNIFLRSRIQFINSMFQYSPYRNEIAMPLKLSSFCIGLFRFSSSTSRNWKRRVFATIS